MTLPIDVFGEVNIEETQIDVIRAAAENHLCNESNWISVNGINPSNHAAFVTSKIPYFIKSGWYAIFKLDSLGNVVYCYVGSSTYRLQARAIKFFRQIFGVTTAGDRNQSHAKIYSDRYGQDVSNTFICYYAFPSAIKDMPESLIRKLEGDLIRSFISRYNISLVNKVTKPTVSKMSEVKRRSRLQGHAKISEDLYND